MKKLSLFKCIYLFITNLFRASFNCFYDVAENIAQEPILCYSRQVHIGGPLNAYWAKGESLGLDTYCRILPKDHKYL